MNKKEFSNLNIALKILDDWYEQWDSYKNNKSLYDKKYALVSKAMGIVKHDRALNGVFYK